MKTILNNLWTHIGHEDDGHLVHTDKRTGKQKISLETWPDVASAREAVAVKLSKIEWEELNELPPKIPPQAPTTIVARLRQDKLEPREF
jgi:hypothetical protein